MFAAAACWFHGGLFLSPPAVLPLEPWKKLLSTSTTWSAKIDCSSRPRRWTGFLCGRCRRSLLTCCCCGCWSMVAGSANSFTQKELQGGGKNCIAIIIAPPRCQQCSSIAYKITSYFELPWHAYAAVLTTSFTTFLMTPPLGCCPPFFFAACCFSLSIARNVYSVAEVRTTSSRHTGTNYGYQTTTST